MGVDCYWDIGTLRGLLLGHVAGERERGGDEWGKREHPGHRKKKCLGWLLNVSLRNIRFGAKFFFRPHNKSPSANT